MLKTNQTIVEETEYLKYVAKMPYGMSAINITGSFNFVVFFYYRDLEHMNKIVSNILEKSNAKDQYIITANEILFTEFSLTDKSINLSQHVKKEDYSYNKIFKEKKQKVKVDEKDIDLLSFLANDARISLTKLAERLKLNRETINYRIKKLVRGGIIQKFQPNVNPYAMGYYTYMLKIKMLDRKKTAQAIRFIESTKKANDIVNSYESWNIMAFLHYDDVAKLKDFENELVERFGKDMLEYDIDIIKSQSKLDWFPREVAEDIKNKNW